MSLNVIITTYNRPFEVLQLSNEVLACQPAPEKLIIVDSSDVENLAIQKLPKVIYIRSSHKNQPYQRLLGAQSATSEIIVFLDDDLSILDKDVFQLIEKPFQCQEIAGVSVGFEHHSLTNQSVDVPLWVQQGMISRFIWLFTGVPMLKTGKIGRLGITGVKPNRESYIESFNGANMAFRREVVLKCITIDLLAQVERKLNMGEDKVISMLASQYGKLHFIPKKCLSHPPNISTYFQDIRTFTTKITYSRLYLSRIYAHVYMKSWWKEKLIYYWFTFWRILIAFIFLILRPSKIRREKLLGTLDGLWLSITLPQKANWLTPEIEWEYEIHNDLKNTKVFL